MKIGKLVLLATLGACGVALGEVNLRFGFITDTHVNAAGSNLDRVRGAFTLFRAKAVDLVVHGGDIANAHYPTAYAAVSNLFDEVFGDAKPRFIAAVGNHDTTMELNGLTQLQAAEETLALTGVENTHTDSRSVNGYTFLTMPYAVGGEGFLSWDDYEAAVSNACEAAVGRPVFVLEHEPPQDTVYNSHNWGYARSKAILSRYPQVVELSGHVHGSLHSDLFLWQGAFTVLNACCLDTWQGLLNDQPAAGGQNKPSYGALVVEVEDARIVAYRYDVTTGEEIDPDHRWEFPLPFDAATAPYNRETCAAAEVAPAFGADDALTVTPGATYRTFTLSFPEVQDNTLTYWITIERWNGSVWTTMREQEVFSEFWKQTAAKTGRASVTVTDDTFEPLEEYRFRVQPVGQYGTRGAALVATATAATAGEKPDCFLDYVRVNGTQYFDTGVIGRSGTKVDMEIRFDLVGDDWAVLDCRKDDSDSRFFPFHTSAGFAAFGYGSYRRQDAHPLEAGRRYRVESELKAGLQTLDLDGVRIASESQSQTIDTGANLYLFACNYATRSSAQYPCKGRVYSLKIWQTDTNGVYRLVRDFVPCMAPTGIDFDNVSRRTRVGALFDRVTERIFFAHKAADRSTSYDQGASNGCALLPEVWNTTSQGRPDYFVEYIRSSGSQVLDTGVPARAGLRLEGDLQYTDTFNSSEEVYLGVSIGDFFTIVDRPNGRAWGALGAYQVGRYLTNETTGVEARWNLGQKYHVAADVRKAGEGDSTIVQDGETIYRTPGTTFSAGANLMMFANCRNGFPAYTAQTRCYGLKIWLDGELVRDFRPCVKGGKPGLYDAVRNEVVFPLGEMDVSTVGEPVNEDGSADALPWVQLGSNQYIDLDVVGRSGTKVEMDILFPLANNGGDHAVIGSRKDSSDSRFFPFHQHADCGRYGYVTFKYLNDPLPDNVIHHVESDLRAGSQVVKVNGVTVASESNAAVVDTGVNMYLGAVNYGGPQYQWPVRVYSLKIWQTATTAATDTDYVLVRDFVPAFQNREPGLLDRVSGKIFRPKGVRQDVTDLRLRGPFYETKTVAGRPDAFVEYIESNGQQVLPIGVQAQPGISASGEMMWTGRFTEEQTHLGVNNWPGRLYLVHNVRGDVWYGYTPDFGCYPVDPAGERVQWGRNVRQRYDVDFSDPAHLKGAIDGVQVMDGAFTNEIGVSSGRLSMFAATLSDGYVDFISKSRCYWSQIRVNGELVRDFLPCVKDGKGGLYDAVHDEIYFPIVGEFTGGLVGAITNGADLVANTYVSYVESDGNAWIDTGVIGRSGTKVQIEFTPLWTPKAGNDWSTVDMGILGARPELWGSARVFPAHSYGGVFGFGYGGITYTAASLTDGAAHRVESELRPGLQQVRFDGELVATETSAAVFDTGLPMYLGAVNVGGEAMYQSPTRFHRVKIWQTATTNANDTAYALVRDYRPVVTAGGIIGLKDAVHNKLVLPARPFVAHGDVLATGTSIFLR